MRGTAANAIAAATDSAKNAEANALREVERAREQKEAYFSRRRAAALSEDVAASPPAASPAPCPAPSRDTIAGAMRVATSARVAPLPPISKT